VNLRKLKLIIELATTKENDPNFKQNLTDLLESGRDTVVERLDIQEAKLTECPRCYYKFWAYSWYDPPDCRSCGHSFVE
jgi:uncharacterized protein with PIN domain